MKLIDHLGAPRWAVDTILGAIAVGNLASWVLALVPGPGWAVKAGLATAAAIIKHQGKAAAAAW